MDASHLRSIVDCEGALRPVLVRLVLPWESDVATTVLAFTGNGRAVSERLEIAASTPSSQGCGYCCCRRWCFCSC